MLLHACFTLPVSGFSFLDSNSINPSGLTSTNCVLSADFRKVPRQKFKQCTRKDGRKHYEVHYNLNVTFDSAMMRFSCEMGGQEMGAVEAKYN